MSIEEWRFEEEKKKKKLEEINSKKEDKETFEKKQKNKEEILSKIETSEYLYELQELVKKWVITEEVATKLKTWKNINQAEIEEMFNKINEIEEIKDIDKYLPEDLRISKEEYLKALENKIFRIQTITKLDLALAFIVNQIEPWDSIWWVNIFGWFLWILDQNLRKIQENTIDIKDSLIKIDWNKNIDNKTLRQKIIKFIKEIFK